MIGVGESILGLGLLGAVCFWLWLKDRRPRAIAAEVIAAKEAAREARDAVGVGLATMRTDFASARAEVERIGKEHRDEALKFAAEIRGEMNQLVAATGLLRRPGQPFAQPRPMPGPEVVAAEPKGAIR